DTLIFMSPWRRRENTIRCSKPIRLLLVGGVVTYPHSARPRIRACLKIGLGAAAGDFGWGQGGEAGASPQRAVTAKPTQSTGKRTAARRVFAEKAVWLRCSSVEDTPGIFSFVAPRHPAFSPKTASSRIFRQAFMKATINLYTGMS